MKLSLPIILDELESFSPIAHFPEGDDAPLCHVRFLGEEPAQPETLYVAKGPNLPRSFASDEQPPLIVVGEADEVDRAFPAWRGIIVGAEQDCVLILQTVQGALDRFARWERDLLAGMAAGHSHQKLLDIGARELRNPIVLCDVSTMLLLRSGNVPEHETPSVWDEEIESGHLFNERLGNNDLRRLYAITNPDADTFEFGDAYHVGEERLGAFIKLRGTTVGLLGTTNIANPITAGQRQVLARLRDLLEFSIGADPVSWGFGGRAGGLVDALLGGQPIAESAVEERLTFLGWSRDDAFGACFIREADGSEMTSHICSELAVRLEETLRPMAVVPWKDGLAVILRAPSHLDAKSTAEKLAPILEGFGLVCGMSLEAHDFMWTRKLVDQAELALLAETHEHDALAGDGPHIAPGTCTVFGAAYAAELACALARGCDPLSLCHPSVALTAASGEAERDLLRTFLVYLETGMNMSLAARCCSMHRSSLAYRVERVQKLLGVEDPEPGSDDFLFLAFSCALALEVS